MKENIQDFYSLLFKTGEGIAFQQRGIKEEGGEWRKNRIRIFAKGLFDNIDFDYELFCVNPIDPYHDNNPDPNNPKHGRHKPRATNANIMHLRNMMIEFDDNTLREQAQRVNQSEMPWSTKLFSGNKSYHYILAFDRVLTEFEWYNTYDQIEVALRSFGLKLDGACRTLSRLSRAPGRTNTKHGKLQEVKEIREVINWDEFCDWLAQHAQDPRGIKKPKFEEVTHEYTGTGNANDEYRFKVARAMCIRYNGKYHDADQWQPWLYQLGKYCKKFGLTQDMSISLAKMQYQHPEDGVVETAIKNAFIYSHPTLVTLDMPDETGSRDAVDNINTEIVDLNQNGLSDYIRVGNKYYRADNYDITLWDKSTIRDDFGSRALQSPQLRKYRGFINEPNYLEHIEHLTVGEHTFYNTFRYPVWELKKGEFPTITKLLKRVFIGDEEDQYEIGLDWIQLLITKPKQRTRALALVSIDGEAGKDTFMNWLTGIVGENGIVLNGDEIDDNFNNLWARKHVICLNEVALGNVEKKTRERIKNLLTGEKISVEGKGDNKYQIENYAKIVMATNNVYDFLRMDAGDNRYWVRKMRALQKGDKDPRFIEKLEEETPYFLNWIINHRELYRKESAGRFWHSNEECWTQAGADVVDNSHSGLYEDILSVIEDRFRDKNLADEDSIFVRVKSLTHQLNRFFYGPTKQVSQKAVKMCLLKEFKLPEIKSIRADAFDNMTESNNIFFEFSRKMIGIEEQFPKYGADLPYLDMKI